MAKQYWITVKANEDLSNDYRTVAPGWEYAGASPSEEENGHETWTCKTDMPDALEALLNTDRAVVNYTDEEPNGY